MADKHFAHVVDNTVREVITLPSDCDVDQTFSEEFRVDLREVGLDVSTGWVYNGVSFSAPVPVVKTLSELTAAKTSEIVSAADTLLSTGAPVSGGLHVALDDGSRADLSAMATTAIAATNGAVVWPESYSRGWISVENERIPLPQPSDGLALAAAVGGYYAAVVQNRRDLKDAVVAVVDSASLGTIDVSAGWPATT